MIAALVLFLLSHDRLIVPGERVGPATVSTSEAELIRAVGEQNVRRRPVHVGEGEGEAGTILYPDKPTSRLGILWADARRTRLRRVDVYPGPERKSEACEWRTVQGITLGRTLKGIERLNSRPFLLPGFAWEYEGTVIDWRGGRLGRPSSSGGRLLLRLAPREEDVQLPGWRQVQGDRSFSSGHPVIERLNPRICAIILEFAP